MSTSSSLTLAPLTETRRPFQSGISTRGRVSKTARKVMGSPSAILRSSTRGAGQRLEAAVVELLEDVLVDDGLRGLAEDVLLEAALDHVGGDLARAEAGQASLLRELLRPRRSISAWTISGSTSKASAFRTEVSSMYSTCKGFLFRRKAWSARAGHRECGRPERIARRRVGYTGRGRLAEVAERQTRTA